MSLILLILKGGISTNTVESNVFAVFFSLKHGGILPLSPLGALRIPSWDLLNQLLPHFFPCHQRILDIIRLGSKDNLLNPQMAPSQTADLFMLNLHCCFALILRASSISIFLTGTFSMKRNTKTIIRSAVI